LFTFGAAVIFCAVAVVVGAGVVVVEPVALPKASREK